MTPGLRAGMPQATPVGRVEAVAAGARGDAPAQEAFGRLLQAAPGRRMQADVLASLGRGDFLVRVEGALLRMPLPPGTRAGDSLALRLLGHHPRLAFEMAGRSPDPGATLTLTDAGRLVDAILQAAGRAAQPRVITSAAPLLDAGPPDAGRLAHALADTIARSGVFYESHLRAWADGQRRIETLFDEPQARRRAASTSGATPSATADPELLRLVGLQLDALEEHRVAWHGEPWPGQQAAVEIREDAPHRDPPRGDGAPAGWSGDLALTLPRLGALRARLAVGPDGTRIRLAAVEASAVARLRDGAPALTATLAAAGVSPARLEIVHDAA